MPQISIQKPTDQPTGTRRLLDELDDALTVPAFESLRIISAFTKSGPLHRLRRNLESFRQRGGLVRGIVGIDHRGTSREALQLILAFFDEAHVAHVVGPFSPTFHPKIYLLEGVEQAIAWVGSNNLTVGGTETNLETFIRLDLTLPADEETLDEVASCWEDALRISRRLDDNLLGELIDRRLVGPERTSRAAGTRGRGVGGGGIDFPEIEILPPRALPTGSLRGRRRPAGEREPPATGEPADREEHLRSTTLVIQIIPHHNGEVFLSKTAVNQNPDFFGFPFTGWTTPKSPRNRPYPQRLPDPVVDLTVYDAAGDLVTRHSEFGLNTVYYENKSEIRITVPQDVVAACPEYSVMVMQLASDPLDYTLDIYIPGSAEYDTYVAACNQTMPSGGKPVARRFGWL